MDSGPAIENGQALSIFQKLAYSLGNFAQGVGPAIVVGWLQYFYTKSENTINGVVIAGGAAFLSYTAFGLIAGAARMMEAISNPLIGYLSDKTRTRFGRRKTWIVFFTPLMALSFVGLWFPLYPRAHYLNGIYLAVLLGLFWLSFAGVVGPYLSLLPEITPYIRERIKLSEIMGYFEVAGFLVSTIVAGKVIEIFSGGVDIGVFHLIDGYKFLAIIVGLLIVVCFYWSIRFVSETPHSTAKEVPFNFPDAVKNTFKNRLFAPYVLSVSFFRIGIDSVIISMPYLVVKILGKKEDLAGLLQGAVIIFSVLLFPLVSSLSTRFGKKIIYLTGLLGFSMGLPLIFFTGRNPILGAFILKCLEPLGLSFQDPLGSAQIAHIIIVLLVISFPISTAFVLPRPIFADVVDVDEQLTGYRREAMYNGMEGIISKSAAAVVPVFTTQLFAMFGATSAKPLGILLVGPVAGVLVFLGFVAFLRYPLKK